MAEIKQVRIGELLKEYGYLDDESLQKALIYQKQNNIRLGQAVIALGFVTEREVLEALSHKLGLPLIKLDTARVETQAVAKLPRSVAEKYTAITISEDDGHLNLVINDPLDLYAIEEIQRITQMPATIIIGEKGDIQKAISHYYSEVEARQAVSKVDSDMSALFPEIEEINTVELGDDATPVVSLLNSLMLRAYNNGASDLHLEPFDKNCKVRMRVDGALVDYAEIPKNVHPALIVRLKIMGNLDIAEKRLPQDGHFRIMIENIDLNVRISVIPTVYGEKAVLRFLSTNTAIDHAGQFGMIDEDYEKFLQILANPNGIIYITGPTGSGKTTTMYMALDKFKEKQINISSIEDPVEKNIDGINQVQVNNQAGLTFDRGLRSLLRQDPDIIMVGETRDSETASISVSAAITGHLVISTLHTNDALTSIVRLEDMGVPPYLVGNSVVGLVAQRLIRKICPHCTEEYEPSDLELLTLGESRSDVPKLKRGTGCHVCNQTGYKGRVAIHEIILVDKKMQRMIAEEAQMSALYEYARKEMGMATLRERAQALTISGVTSMEEFLKIGETVD
ncbi:MAG: Flp pilus assembly complex ATPase component TadA [Clostridiales Family XIII bacterium]|jgi:type IV pilus assembly protein PilB|nr:Flp pilus assembly complex ATPase component TadA [Clostridiales Family XIII bacterium]